MSETALIERARRGDEYAFDQLYRSYLGLIRFMLNGLGTRSLDPDDLLQVGALAFYRAVCTYDGGRGQSFRNYVAMAVQRAAWTAIKMALRNKHQVLNEAASLSQPVSDGGVLADTLPGSMEQEPATVLIAREAFARKLALVASGTPLERTAVVGVANGLTYREISDRTGHSEKSIDNAIQRARARVRLRMAA